MANPIFTKICMEFAKAKQSDPNLTAIDFIKQSDIPESRREEMLSSLKTINDSRERIN